MGVSMRSIRKMVFGVAPGTNEKSNPNALASTRQGTIFTNVAHNLDDNTVWWEGLDKNPPNNAIDWKGNPWNGKESAMKRERIPTAALRHRQRIARASATSLIKAPACRFPPLSSVAAAPDHASGIPVPRLEPRRVCRFHHGFRDDGCCNRRGRRCPP